MPSHAVMRQIGFLVIVNVIWVLAHVYLGRRLVESAGASGVLRVLGWGVLGASLMVGLAVTWSRVVGFSLPFAATFQWVAYFVMGIFLLTLTMTIVRDVVVLLIWPLYAAWQHSRVPDPQAPEHMAQLLDRRRMIFGATSAAIGGGAMVGAGVGYREATKVPRVKEVQVKIAGMDPRLDGLKIVQLSDIHVGPTIGATFLSRVIEIVNALEADVVCITGDLVDGHVPEKIEVVSLIEGIKAKYGRFFVTGNHEYYWDGPAWARAVAGLKWRVLLNEHEIVEHESGATFAVAGVTDYSAQKHVPSHASDPVGAARGIAQEVSLKVLLAHQPKSVWKAAEAGFDLQLSGHTHGGQFYPWNVVVGLAHPFSKGLHAYESMQIYVSCGTGYWGPPLRLGAPSEITVLHLSHA